ncbi:MAG TPA: hypothetical protein VL404_09905 [Candidatus Eisenbacteria bacterium]|nr:hypothetical protein [Candidatus Eisenbacteria bacterium]
MKTFKEDVFLNKRALYEKAIRDRVCAHCEDRGEDGTCRTKDPDGCAIHRSLADLLQIAWQIDSGELAPYIEAVRKDVCQFCSHETAGKCEVRNHLDCGLDRYLELVIEAVQEVDEALGLRKR